MITSFCFPVAFNVLWIRFIGRDFDIQLGGRFCFVVYLLCVTWLVSGR